MTNASMRASIRQRSLFFCILPTGRGIERQRQTDTSICVCTPNQVVEIIQKVRFNVGSVFIRYALFAIVANAIQCVSREWEKWYKYGEELSHILYVLYQSVSFWTIERRFILYLCRYSFIFSPKLLNDFWCSASAFYCWMHFKSGPGLRFDVSRLCVSNA